MHPLSTPAGFRVYLVELEALDASSFTTTTLKFSNHSFVTKPSDSPPNSVYLPRVNNALEFSRDIYSPGSIGGESYPGSGFVELNNHDGYLDYMYNSLLLIGRGVIIKYGDQHSSYNEFITVLTGVIESLEFSEDSVTVSLKDNKKLLQKEVSTNQYSASNTFNESLHGKPLPLCYGECYNITPKYVGKTESDGLVTDLTYQVHDGPVQDIVAVYSNGNLIDPLNITKDLAAGKFTINIASVASFSITADVKGDNSGTGYIDKVPDIIQRLLEDKAPRVPLVLSRFSQLYSDSEFLGSPIASVASSGIYIDSGGPVEAALEELTTSIGAYYGFDRLGRFDIGVFSEPYKIGAPVAGVINNTEILSITREPVAKPSHQHSLGYKKNYTVLTSDSIAPEIVDNNPERYTFLQEKFREVVVDETEAGRLRSNTNVIASPANSIDHWLISDLFPTSRKAELVESLMVSPTYARLEARRRWRLYNNYVSGLVQRERFEIVLKNQPFELDLNDTVQVFTDRYGLSNGKYFKIVSFDESAFDNEVTIGVWG